MKQPFRLKHLEKVVSVFVFLALFFLASMLIFLAKQKKLFASKVEYYTIINSMDKISIGQEITLKGPNIPIGKITQYSITKENKVKIEFFIYKEYTDKIRTDTVIMFDAPLLGFLGGLKVQVSNGNRYYAKSPENSLIPSNQMQEGIFLMQVNGLNAGKKEIPIVDKLNPLLENLTKILDPRGPLVRHLNTLLQHSSNFTMQLSQEGLLSVMGSRTFKSNLERITTNLNVILASGEKIMNNDLKQTLTNLSSLLEGLKRTTGTVNYNLPKLMGRLNSILYRLQRMVKGLERSPLFTGGELRRSRRRRKQSPLEGP